MDWFDFKGERSTDYGVRVMKFPPFTLLAERKEFKQVPGRSGSLTIVEDDTYDDVVLPFSCFSDDLSRVDQIGPWLRGDGFLVSGNLSNRCFQAQLANQIDLDKIIRNDEHRAFTVIFRCAPHRLLYPAQTPYHYQNPPIGQNTITNGGTIFNPGNTYSEPIYTIRGTGDIDLTIGEKTISIVGLNGSITIDMSLRVAYQTASNPLVPLTSAVKTNFWPFTIPPGTSIVSWPVTNNIAELAIDPRWRYI